ncbi:FtsX-like permease family protein [Exiguobacterium sp. Helios]|uniref:ABC transporter permease n=1 Tax=unclassified Exiguobacterium TaxID=2644629 RepID=UPI001048BF6D|nr:MULTISPECIES: FtsX-like permease family protein [unclassified Exiguobacterium]QNR22049.1 FtsX-like permease family protein [Exiguobacterium sp. Helios]
MNITYLQYALRNIKRYQRLYYGYALTIIVAMTIATSYWNLVVSESFQNIAKVLSQLNQVIELTMLFVFIAEVIILFFSILFIYSTTYTMLEHRKNDLRVMRTLGSGFSHFLKYFMIEILIVGGLAIIGGITLGVVLTKLMLLSIEKVMFLPRLTIELSLTSFLVLIAGALLTLLIATVLAIYRFRPDRPVRSRSRFRIRFGLTMQGVAVLILFYGYFMALTQQDTFLFVFPFIIFVGSFFFCRHVIPMVLKLYRPRRLSLRKLIVSEIAIQLKTNSTLVALGTILTSCALTAVGLVFIFQLIGFDLSSNNQFGLVYYEEAAVPSERLEKLERTMTKTFPDKYRQDVRLKGVKTRYVIPLSDYNELMKHLGHEQRTLLTDKQTFMIPARPVQVKEVTPTMQKAKAGMKQAGYRLEPMAEHRLLFGYNDRIETLFVVSDRAFTTMDRPVFHIRVFDTPSYADYGTDRWTRWMSIVREIQSKAELGKNTPVPYQLINETEDKLDGIRIIRLVSFVVILLTVWLFVINASFLHVWMQMTAEREQKRLKTLSALGFSKRSIRRFLFIKYGTVLMVPYFISIFHAWLLFQVILSNGGLEIGPFLPLSFTWIGIVTGCYFISILPLWVRYPRHLMKKSCESSMYPIPDSRV